MTDNWKIFLAARIAEALSGELYEGESHFLNKLGENKLLQNRNLR
jgi:hypothetical protein